MKLIQLKKIVPLAVLLTVITAGCGGGGGDSSSAAPAAAPAAPMTLSDSVVAIKVASNLVETGPVGLASSRVRTDPISDWSGRTGKTTTGCTVTDIVNDDGMPTVGDRIGDTYSNCQARHLSGGISSTTGNVQSSITLLTDPRAPQNAAWRYGEQTVVEFVTTVSPIVVATKYRLDGTATSRSTFAFATEHAADGTQLDSVVSTTTGKETSSLGDSDVVIQSKYACQYAAIAASPADCGDVLTTLTGKVFGATVNATMTLVSKVPMTFQIQDGALRFTIELTQDSQNVRTKVFTLKAPSGETLTLTGEDTNWLRIF